MTSARLMKAIRAHARGGPEQLIYEDAPSSGFANTDLEMHAALDINIPNYANAIVTTTETVDSISSLSTMAGNS